jgi:phosphoglycolate phosphatase-like HAD superfamily hydrolase
MVGDSKPDSECAYDAGCFSVIIGSGNWMEEDYLQKIATMVFMDLGYFYVKLGW